MNLHELDYNLPRELIAQQPCAERDRSNLMVVDRKKVSIEHKKFFDLVNYLGAGDVLVINTSKVIPSRFFCYRCTGAKIEVLYVGKKENLLHCLLDTPRFLKQGETLRCGSDIKLELKQRLDYGWLCEASEPIESVMEKIGTPPLPPYIKRPKGSTEQDRERYQTVYADTDGSIAAPTAGLHFTDELISRIAAKGVKIARILLHVGIGTFKPIKAETLEGHKMEKEYYEIGDESIGKISNAKRVVVVGTTCARALESFRKTGQSKGITDLFIKPGHEFKSADALVTNFHLPKTTLLALVVAFAGKELIFKAYEEAIAKKYRFFSYGDVMLIV